MGEEKNDTGHGKAYIYYREKEGIDGQLQ